MRYPEEDWVFYTSTSEEHGHTEERVRKTVSEVLQIDRTDSRLSVRRAENGSLYLPFLPVFVSVSHNGGIWLCAVSTAPVGVDLQFHTARKPQRISERYFTAEEQDFLRENTDFFYKIWTAKESLLKMESRRESGLREISVLDQKGHLDLVRFQYIPISSSCTCCKCGGRYRRSRVVEFIEER